MLAPANRLLGGAAIASPLLEGGMAGAIGVLFNITGGEDLTLHEVNEAAGIITAAADPQAQVIFGTALDPRIGDAVRITVIATGFDPRPPVQPAATPAGRGAAPAPAPRPAPRESREPMAGAGTERDVPRARDRSHPSPGG